jgi:hypothetical protein
VRLTPLQVGEQIEESIANLRIQDLRQLQVMQGQLTSAVEEVKKLSARARIASDQVRREKIVGGLSFLGGLGFLLVLAQIGVAFR